MIGKAQWFTRRKYTGWGFSPKTWQGWVYLGVMVALFLATYLLPAVARVPSMIVLGAVLGIDFLDIILHLKNDERERKHEAIAERNVAWVMITVLAIGVAYQAAASSVKGTVAVDPFIIAAVALGLLTKIISNIILDRTD